MTTITIPAEYGYTLAVSVVSSILVTALGVKVGTYRKVAGVNLPQMYADDEEAKKDKKKMIFNCKQRVHQNTLEGFTTYMASLLIAGIQYPTAAAGLGLVWCAGRILYSMGYSSGDPAKRSWGGFGHIGGLGLLGLVGKMAYDLIVSA
ncbi:Microsomal glutathione S-transferase 3 [Entomortierella chlamydospora]|uniref:Glutathione S-transferase 3, mitochondrial n=1 Tax=Entomortierella chlamydospora TaxID=101097 RepID=A0A9P6MP77_9FUNG|nr:Microsomal glutathione S-transferase 3 [Entomortierella chlamydospora]KAG0009031.1 Microsomal glutathione S-transferase 3 [Entomortierella chlamydospora]